VTVSPVTADVSGRFSVDVDNLDEGTYRVYVTQTDDPGNLGQSAIHEFTIDRTAPEVTITPSSQGSFPSSLAFTVSPDTVAVECAINGIPVDDCQSPVFPYYYWTGGLNTFSVRAVDAAGNVGASAYAWYIDDVAPNLEVTSPVSGLVTNDDTVTITGTGGLLSSDDDTVEVWYYQPLGVSGGPVAGSINQTTGLFSITMPALEGTWLFEIQQGDASGNVATVTRSVTIDTIAPTVSLTNSPVDNSTTSLTGATIEYDTTGGDIVSTTCTLDGVALASCTSPVAVTGLADGSHTFAITVADAAGNSDSADVS